MMHFWSKFGNLDFNRWWLLVRTSWWCSKYWFLSGIWPRSRWIVLQNHCDLNQGPLHLWSKFDDPSLNDWWVITQRTSWLTDIITLVLHKKSPIRHKMHGSTQKSPVRHKNARFNTKMPSPACTSWHCHYQTSPHPSCEKYFFPILFQYFVFKNQ